MVRGFDFLPATCTFSRKKIKKIKTLKSEVKLFCDHCCYGNSSLKFWPFLAFFCLKNQYIWQIIIAVSGALCVIGRYRLCFDLW